MSWRRIHELDRPLRRRARRLGHEPDRVITPDSSSFTRFAHALIDQLALDAGYPAASLRERLYVGDDMQGFLVYTATTDSAGSLGGLVAQGESATARTRGRVGGRARGMVLGGPDLRRGRGAGSGRPEPRRVSRMHPSSRDELRRDEHPARPRPPRRSSGGPGAGILRRPSRPDGPDVPAHDRRRPRVARRTHGLHENSGTRRPTAGSRCTASVWSTTRPNPGRRSTSSSSPTRGVLCLEVKGGTLVHRDGDWFQNERRMKQSPFAQAGGGSECSLRLSSRARPSRRRSFVGHGVLFPESPFALSICPQSTTR